MIVLKFFTYIYYRLKSYYSSLAQAIIVFNLCITFNVIATYSACVFVEHLDTSSLWFFKTSDNYFYDRFVYGLSKVAPIYLGTYLISLIFKKRIENYMIEFENESKKDKKKRSYWLWCYLTFTVMYFVLGFVLVVNA